MRYGLRTLLIVLTIGPPLFAQAWWAWPKVVNTPKQHSAADFEELIALITATLRPDPWDDIGGPGSVDAFGCILLVEVNSDDDSAAPHSCGRGFSFRCDCQAADYGFAETPIATVQPTDDPFGPK
jgi:hypothetical protein